MRLGQGSHNDAIKQCLYLLEDMMNLITYSFIPLLAEFHLPFPSLLP